MIGIALTTGIISGIAIGFFCAIAFMYYKENKYNRDYDNR